MQPIYWYNKGSNTKRVHIQKGDGRSYCKLENGTWWKKLNTLSREFPENRSICSICNAIYNREQLGITIKKIRPQAKFYKSYEWAQLRYKAFMKYGRECIVCGNSKNLTVDHIKPISKFPELQKDIDNLQIMCRLCNRGKSGWDQTDWREKEIK